MHTSSHPAPQSRPSQASWSQQERVLVVEDDDAIREALAAILGESYEVASAPDLGTARSALGRGAIDMVVLDLTLGGEHGEELLEELSTRTSAPPVLVLSASKNARQIAAHYGVPHLAKPFDLDGMLAAVAVAIENDARPMRR